MRPSRSLFESAPFDGISSKATPRFCRSREILTSNSGYAPHGMGMLYVRRERIPEIWPLQAADASKRADIRKFEDIGTHPAANALAVAEAITFTQAIGIDNKAARLVYLRDRWASALRQHPRVRLHTSLRPGRAYAIAMVEVDGVEPGKIYEELWTKHRIITSPPAGAA